MLNSVTLRLLRVTSPERIKKVNYNSNLQLSFVNADNKNAQYQKLKTSKRDNWHCQSTGLHCNLPSS